ncbi:GGDEF domain-containing protein [Cellvibrio mixtus]|uniref:GGDEF domain-containing protein n=1 Tax=Cellvibrio mixtus TaxID=39650 RepID=UPI00058786B7|nr:GGDEF domain-containing protein [Cellvibrio mixtus]
MNDKNFNSVLLASILITLILVVGVHFVPNKRLLLLPDSSARLYLLTKQLPDGSPSSEWTNDQHTAWKCTKPEHYNIDYFPCAFTIDMSKSAEIGIDLSSFNHINLHLNYQGSSNKIRIAIRNFNNDYSKASDNNSTKFNAIQIHASELNKELHLPLSSFAVADWWLTQYNIPLSRSAPEMNNTMVITVDFGEPIQSGTHSFELKKIELQGDWIAVEYWYLGILILWLGSIFIFAIKRLFELNEQTRHDTQVINQLSNTNEQLQEETNKFRRLSTVDPLTQLYNRFGIDQIIASFSGSSHLHSPSIPNYSLLVIDIDHFKHVNDQHGHDCGDLVLQHIAKIIQSNLRAGDFVGRWGGEEFVVIMPGANQKTAMAIAEIIREVIFNTPCNLEKPLTVSASFGVSERHIDEDFASCFKRADNALYRAKQQGRNCSVYAEEQL